MVVAAVLGFIAFWIAMRVRVDRRHARLEAGTFAGLAEDLMALDASAPSAARSGLRLAA